MKTLEILKMRVGTNYVFVGIDDNGESTKLVRNDDTVILNDRRPLATYHLREDNLFTTISFESAILESVKDGITQFASLKWSKEDIVDMCSFVVARVKTLYLCEDGSMAVVRDDYHEVNTRKAGNLISIKEFKENEEEIFEMFFKMVF